MNYKRISLLTISFILGINIFYAQNNLTRDTILAKIDSLEDLIYNSLGNNLGSKDKIKICDSLAYLYLNISNTKSVEYAVRALKMAESEGDNDLIKTPLDLLGKAYLYLDEYSNSINYYKRLYQIYEEEGDDIKGAETLQKIGISYFHWSKYVEAKKYYDRALAVFRQKQYSPGIANTLRAIAAILGHWAEYDASLSAVQEALKFYEQINDKQGIAYCYNTIGVIYQDIGDYKNSLKHFTQSLHTFENINDIYNIVNLNLHIGDIYLRLNDYDKAFSYYFKARDIGKKLDNKKLKAITLSNIGEAYYEKGDYQTALEYQKQALLLKKEIGDKKRLSITYIELGKIYHKLKDQQKALEYLNKGLGMAREINSLAQISEAYQELSKVYYNLGNYKKSLDYYRFYVEIQQKIFSEEKNRTIAELNTKYQLEKKEKENERLRHSEQLQKVQIKYQWLGLGLVVVILIASVFILFIYRSRFKQIQKLNIQLSKKNKEIDKQKENVQKLNKELQEANKTKDKFFSIVAHDLKNPFNSLIVLTGLLIEEYDLFTEEERKEFIKQIKESAENTFSLLQNLLDWSRTQTGKQQVNKEVIDLEALTAKTVKLLKSNAENKKIEVTYNVKKGTTAFADKNMISTVLLNIVSNAIKFTYENGKVNISMVTENNTVEVKVSDTGTGIPEQDLKNLFRIDHKIQTKGTANETGTGLGLVLCKEFVEKNGGKIWVNSEYGRGSDFHFTIPKK